MFDPRSTVLLCEDNEDDALLTLRMFKNLKISNPVVHVWDGVEAIEYLNACKLSDPDKNPFPGAIITDVKMPRADGFAILQWLSERGDRPAIPVVVWSSSALPADINKAYELGSHCYIKKMADLKQWEMAVSALFCFWNFCEFPR